MEYIVKATSSSEEDERSEDFQQQIGDFACERSEVAWSSFRQHTFCSG